MNKRPPLKSLYAFVAVAETGSMTEAAGVLSVSHSAISQAIKSLESIIGQPLFQRVGRQVQLNSVGQKYYNDIAPALKTIVDATEAVTHQPQSNRITLNMINSLAIHWWVPRVDNFQQYAPNADIRLSNLIGPFDLNQEGVDVAIIHGKSDEWEDYYCEKLGDDELLLVCSPDLLDSSQDIPSAAELLQRYPAIYAENLRRKQDWSVWCQGNSLPVPKKQNNLSFIASIHAVQAAIRKLGVFVTHRLFVRDEIKHGLLVEIGSPVKNPHLEFFFVCKPEKLRNENVLKLKSWLSKEFNNTSDE
ncbi:LysR substrate-binding domain-containing protein [Vibrio natriegens]|uniref:LysR family transcriptional regulator n=1 Tax=Vibrio natriegens NBRC 15636 = ATCC 14048 = DSM 759 TaxID=1219067 RepID=A0AAN0Y830_VIBNA|nr:LysR substrate-binding domain-containing protein [Vibrio natriegens]ALR18092.1 LysR family transcriptional regulator [Vibrio natriegens NBRC 15636 = ATCC 14048 = DSM 759]ANQ15594.1 LysR family transcriptional regulator [Vibrio natriegens NBRC 15636 = ATCC 14048 = DSM 759]EPM41568.1 LysR family transcriptional regulator [Vibrio natriegens NBRC 15636 = ATCC 14048 = DSM 759]MDX6029036.1 LysR substrate-binding domain-containing protein [Vibrio natriegens NBRC 15636 = ATCC 14048 = DSM 759]UUI142